MFCTIQLSKSDPTPLYIQLATELAHLIKSGVFPEHTKLPTIRSLSHKLNINRDTVVSAYKLLENQSLVVGHIGRGTYVAPLNASTIQKTKTPLITCSAINFPHEYFSSDILQELLCDIATEDGWSIFMTPLQRHKSMLYQSLVSYFHSLGIDTSCAQIRILNDLHNFWIHLLKLHPNSCVCIEAYHDSTLLVFLKSIGVKVFEIPVTPEGMDTTYLESILQQHSVSFICTSSYIQNPTGVCYSDKTKEILLTLLDTYDCYLLDDITYIDFAYTTEFINPLFAMDCSDRVITVHHFCKVYLPYLNYSFIVFPPQLSKHFVGLTDYTLNEHILYYYLRSEHFSKLRLELIEKSSTLYKAVEDCLSQLSSVHIFSTDGGLSFFIKPLLLDSTSFIQHFLSFGIVISPSEIFSNKHKEDYFRISISHLNDFQCNQLIDCLYRLEN